MNTITTISWLTFHEARRRRMMIAALALGAIFLLLFAIGIWMIRQEIQLNETPAVLSEQIYSFLTIAGLYVVHFLTVMLAIFASVDSIAGEIASHTIQTIVTKPVKRWQIILGKWLGFSIMIILYLMLLMAGIIGLMYLMTGYLPPNLLQGLPLLGLEALVLVSLSLLGGTYLSTLTNGVVLFMFYGVAFIGTWVEQIGALFQSQSAIRVGIISSLLMPVEAIWRRAAYLMQPPSSQSVPSPFSSYSVPSQLMVWYAIAYALVMLGLAMRSFQQRDL